MLKEKLHATLILDKGDWDWPVCGTPAQHKALCKKAKQYQFTSIHEFLMAWPAYREGKVTGDGDSGLVKVEAHWFFKYLRAINPRILYEREP